MSEETLQWIQLVKLISIAAFATLYGFGGIEGKWKRRFLAPFVLTAALCGISAWVGSFSWWLLLYFPLLAAALTIGYGGNTQSEKIRKRALAGFAAGMAAVPVAVITGSGMVMVLHVAMCTCISVALGVWNPTKSARAEETAIGFIYGFMPLIGMI